MTVVGDELRDGLWRWTAYHEEWREEVGCVALQNGDRWVLIDPLLPRDGIEDLRDVRPGSADVLLTVYWHARSAAAIHDQLGAAVWAYGKARVAVARRTPVTRTFKTGDELPGGVLAYPTARGSEVVFWLPEQRAVAAGDVIHGTGRGLRLCPAAWLHGGKTLADLAASLRPLLELPVELVLTSHGQPVLRDGSTALARLLG